MNHYPKEPTPDQYEILSTYGCNQNTGQVFDSQGTELGRIYAGRYRVQVGDRWFRRAHIIWWAAKGQWPVQLIDHIDRCKTNDIISNLRELSSRGNALNTNRTLSRDLPPNIYLAPEHNTKSKYMAKLWFNSQTVHLGMFVELEEAIDAVDEALLQISLGIFQPNANLRTHKMLPKGVHLHTRNKKNPYKAKGWKNGKEVHLGYYPTPEDARRAYLQFEASK